MSNATEPKRRGRPAKVRDEAVVEAVEADAPDDVVQVVVKPAGPPCSFCSRPLQRSSKPLRRYDLVVLKCDFCKQVSIEGDAENYRWDTSTGIVGNPPPLVNRAMVLYAARHNVQAPPPAKRDGTYEAMHSDWDDERWVEVDL